MRIEYYFINKINDKNSERESMQRILSLSLLSELFLYDFHFYNILCNIFNDLYIIILFVVQWILPLVR